VARIRSIHYDALKSEKLAAASAEAERLYWRLSTHCDDAGRAEDDPRLFAAYLFPLNDDITGPRVDEWLDELEGLGLIVRYEAGERRYLCVTKWSEYQKPNKPTPTKLPAPPEPLRECSGSGSVALPLGVEGSGDGEGDETAAPAARFSTDFADWYDGYPRKRERGNALKAYTARRRAGTSHDDLIAARDNYATAVAGVELDKVKYPASFLSGNDGPWSEWVDGPPEPVRTIGRSAASGPPPFPEPARAVLGRGVNAEPLYELDEQGNAVPRRAS
jgi:hypothetical protein